MTRALGAFFALILLLLAFFGGIFLVFYALLNRSNPGFLLLPLGIALVGAVIMVLWEKGKPPT